MKELSPPPLNLRRLYTETMEWEPVLIIISPGADPSQELAELAAESVGRDSYHEVMKCLKTLQISKIRSPAHYFVSPVCVCFIGPTTILWLEAHYSHHFFLGTK